MRRDNDSNPASSRNPASPKNAASPKNDARTSTRIAPNRERLRGRTLLAAALLGAVLVAACAWWLLSEKPKPVDPARSTAVSVEEIPTAPAPITPTPSAPSETSAAPAALAYRAGESLLYTYRHDRSIRFESAVIEGLIESGAKAGADSDADEANTETPAAPTAVEPIDFAVSAQGKLRVRVYTEDASGWNLGFILESSKFELHSPQADKLERKKSIEKDMREEVLVAIDRSGGIRDIVAAASILPEARNFWKDLLAGFQIQLPEDAAAKTWTKIESDMTGDYVAKYERESEDRISKSKDAYLRVHGQDEKTTRVELEGSTTIELSRIIRSIAGSESAKITSTGGKIGSELEFSFELIENGFDERSADQAQEIVAALREGVRMIVGPGEVTATEDEEVAALDAIPALLDELVELHAKGGAGSVNEAALMARIVDLIRREPKVVKTLLEKLQANSATDELAAVILGALGAAGTEAAQGGLLSVFSSPDWSESRRYTALTSLAQVETPSAEVFDGLEKLHAERGALSTNALLLLGAMASRVKDTDSARYEAIRDEILELAETSSRSVDPETRSDLLTLSAVKNLRLAETPEFVVDLYRTGDDIARLEIMDYLEFTHDERANDLLLRALEQDSSDVVRAAAAAELPDPAREVELERLGELATSDRSIEVRKAVVAGLAERASTEPPVVDLLADVAERSDSEEIRNLATAAIEGL
jgi:hypothetical protein